MADGIVQEREAKGPFAGIEDFFTRVNAKHLNKRALESLVKAGAFDGMGERASILASLDKLIGFAQRSQKQRESGQASLFDLMGAGQAEVSGVALEKVREAPEQQRLAWEKELLGIYLSEHPFARVSKEAAPYLSCSLVEVSTELANRDLIVGGIVSGARSISTKDGRAFLAAELEDMTGSLEVTVWPEVYEQTKDIWQVGNIVIAGVRVKTRDERLQVSVNKAVLYGEGAFDPAALAAEPPAANGSPYRRRGNGNAGRIKDEAPPTTAAAPVIPSSLRILLEETDDPHGDYERLRSLVNALRGYSGDRAVRLAIRQRDGAEVELDLPPARPCPELTQALGDIVGPFGYVGG